jgi:acetate kinase
VLVLVLNCGSSTVKWELFEETTSVATGKSEIAGDYPRALDAILGALPRRPDAVAHRVVHGGDRFTAPAVIDDAVEAEIRRLVPLAPLHNPPALEGIAAARRLGVPMVACFDTAFHATMPEVARRYALPASVPAEVHRYGFHGLSHQYVSERYAELAKRPRPTLVTLHLGSGCSACAIKEGKSVDTSMGFSPLEGLVMGTRPGDLDAAVVLHLQRLGLDVERLLQRESGLAGLAGTNDMRTLLGRRDEAARFAVELFCYRAIKYAGAYLAALGGAEAVVFTGGIGENSAPVVAKICDGLAWAGLALDRARPFAEGRISTAASSLHAWIIKTDEELMIAREAIRLLKGKP